MGIITVDKTDHLFWLGRYTERVYTTLRYFFQSADQMIDSNPGHYDEFCRKIGIENVYETKESFLLQYPFDENNPDSIISNLNRAYDNAIVMRDYIGTETMAYIQLAIDDIHNANRNITTYLSLDLPDSDIIREYRRMKQFLAKSKLRYDEGVINTADSMTAEPPLDHKNLKNLLRNLITE